MVSAAIVMDVTVFATALLLWSDCSGGVDGVNADVRQIEEVARNVVDVGKIETRGVSLATNEPEKHSWKSVKATTMDFLNDTGMKDPCPTDNIKEGAKMKYTCPHVCPGKYPASRCMKNKRSTKLDCHCSLEKDGDQKWVAYKDAWKQEARFLHDSGITVDNDLLLKHQTPP